MYVFTETSSISLLFIFNYLGCHLSFHRKPVHDARKRLSRPEGVSIEPKACKLIFRVPGFLMVGSGVGKFFHLIEFVVHSDFFVSILHTTNSLVFIHDRLN